MTKSEQIAEKISNQIKVWEKSESKMVIVLDGYAGSGKTTIAHLLAKLNKNVAIIHLDDFIKHWKVRKKLMENSLDKAHIFEHQWYRFPKLQEVVKIFKKKSKDILEFEVYDFDKNDFGKILSVDLSKKILIIDGIFLLHPEYKLNGLIDKKIYLDSDHDKADKRRISRDKKQYKEKFLSDDHPENWVKHYKLAYKNYIKKYNPASRADMVFKV